MKALPVIAVLLVTAASANPACQDQPELAGACFVVHGRLRAYNGNPTFRIWPVGTNRILGVTGAHPGEEPILPQDLRVTFDHDLYADFLVCPFTKPQPGLMQRVCIESATHRKPSPAAKALMPSSVAGQWAFRDGRRR